MKIESYANPATVLHAVNTQAKEEKHMQVSKDKQDAVTIGEEARRLFGAQVQLQEAPEEIAQTIASMFKDGGKFKFVESEERLAIRAEQQVQFEDAIEHNVRAIIIPHIQTNDKLVNSLKGASQQVLDATYSTISQNFLVRNIGEMTEEQLSGYDFAWHRKGAIYCRSLLTGTASKRLYGGDDNHCKICSQWCEK